jgi:hypothetical protein
VGRGLKGLLLPLPAIRCIEGVEVIVGRPELKILGGTDQTEREIERAWLQHDPQRDRIPSAIGRRLRVLKKEFEPTSVKIKAALQDEVLLRQLVEDCCRRRGVARQNVLKAARRNFADATIRIGFMNVLEVTWLAPSRHVIADPKDHGQRQDCTLVCYIAAWSTPPFGIRLCSAWSLEIPDHAAGRFLQRAGDNADFRSALFEAANHFYGADMAEVAPHVGRNTDIYLPAGGGAFVSTVIGARSGGHSFLYARAATWVDETMLRADQIPLREAETADRSVAALLLDP